MSLARVKTASRAEASRNAPAELASEHLESVLASSRALGWTMLNFQRHETPAGSRSLPNGSRQHLIIVNLGTGHLVREGAGECVEHELVPGFIAVVPSGMPVYWSWSSRIKFSLLMLQPAFLDHVAAEVFGLAPDDYRLRLTERVNDPAVTNIAGVLAREAARGEPGGRLYADSLASILAVHLLRHYAAPVHGRTLQICGAPGDTPAARGATEPALRTASHPRAVAAALRYIHQNYARELSLNDMAEAAHLSPFHLARLFKQALAISPHQYLIQVRVDSARALLAAGCGGRSLAEVASAVGFADQSHLTRHFKRIMGVTPRQFTNIGNAPKLDYFGRTGYFPNYYRPSIEPR